jgi:two-component system, NtrC family, response regulator AtoC
VPAEPLKLLLVDDDSLTTTALGAGLEHRGGIRVHAVESGEEALEAFSRSTWDAVATDLMMPGIDGIELIRELRASDPSIPLFLFTGSASIRKAVEGIQAGATDFLPKPVDVESFHILLERAVDERAMREELARTLARRASSGLSDLLAGDDPRLDDVRVQAEKVAAMPQVRVLLTGESGTGKSLLARAIHERTGARGRFVSVNCAALPAHLLESELFGHEKGAFTDAKAMKRGLIEMAHGGTIFLDEIGAMPLELQAKLLLFLEERQIRRVGGSEPIPVTAHILTATNEDLRARVEERSFRADLLYRLDVAAIELPPLRDMPQVIPQLAHRFVHEICAEARIPVPPLDATSFAALHRYPWPGNVRELRNAIERALIFREPGPLRVAPPPRAGGRAEGPDPFSGPELRIPLDLTLEELERRYVAEVLSIRGDQDLQDVAAALGISRKSLWEKRKRWEL